MNNLFCRRKDKEEGKNKVRGKRMPPKREASSQTWSLKEAETCICDLQFKTLPLASAQKTESFHPIHLVVNEHCQALRQRMRIILSLDGTISKGRGFALPGHFCCPHPVQPRCLPWQQVLVRGFQHPRSAPAWSSCGTAPAPSTTQWTGVHCFRWTSFTHSSANENLKYLGVSYQRMQLPSVEVPKAEGPWYPADQVPFGLDACRTGLYQQWLGNSIIHRGRKIWLFLSTRQDSPKHPNHPEFPRKRLQWA